MENLWLRSTRNKFDFKHKILLLLLALFLVVMAGLGTAPRAASEKTENKIDETLSSRSDLFDPFTLSTVTPVIEQKSSASILMEPEMRPSIHIPSRPASRGSFRPLVVP